MLGPGRYLLGAGELLLWSGLAGIAAWRLRLWLAPALRGTPAWLATVLIAVAILIWAAELLGSFAAWAPLPYLALLGLAAAAVWIWTPRPSRRRDGRVGWRTAAAGAALAIALLATLHFAAGVVDRLGTGMTGFDSTWYHGPFAAGFFQSGDTWRLHHIAPQFLAWFYPANSEVLHAAGMLAFGRDILSPLLNFGWFVGCLAACWALGRPYRVAPWSLALGALALSVPAFSDQAGEARNDIVGTFFLLAALAVALEAGATRAGGGQAAGAGGAEPTGAAGGEAARVEGEAAGAGGGGGSPLRGSLGAGALAIAGLGAGLAAGTKLNFLPPALVLVLGLVALAPRGARGWALAAAGLPALAGGGYWYLRNLAQAGNPLPWIHHLGPLQLPAPAQALGGREAHSVFDYLTDARVWSDWLLPGLHHGLWAIWPLLALGALAGLLLPLAAFVPQRWPWSSQAGRRLAKDDAEARPLKKDNQGAAAGDEGGRGPEGGYGPEGGRGELAVAGLVGLATALAWLLAPTSASGPEGMPRGFESGLRYLVPALVLGLALLPAAPYLRDRLASLAAPPWLSFPPHAVGKDNHALASAGKDNHARAGAGKDNHAAGRWRRSWGVAALVGALVVVVGAGYAVERRYLERRYADPAFTAPGLNAAFAWARDRSGTRIATTSTRQYPLFGTDLSNRVGFLGVETAHGGFTAAASCRELVRLLNAGRYEYLVASYDRIEPGQPAYPPQARWAELAGAEVVFRAPPAVVLRIAPPLDPAACP